jgi:uncharacterized membrane protein
LPSLAGSATKAAKETAMPTARILPIAAMFALLAMAPAAAQDDEDRERCYGVAPAGEADGLADAERPGSGAVDYQGDAWVWVPRGTCLTTALPPQPDGTPRRGALEPLERDQAGG